MVHNEFGEMVRFFNFLIGPLFSPELFLQGLCSEWTFPGVFLGGGGSWLSVGKSHSLGRDVSTTSGPNAGFMVSFPSGFVGVNSSPRGRVDDFLEAGIRWF